MSWWRSVLTMLPCCVTKLPVISKTLFVSVVCLNKRPPMPGISGPSLVALTTCMSPALRRLSLCRLSAVRHLLFFPPSVSSLLIQSWFLRYGSVVLQPLFVSSRFAALHCVWVSLCVCTPRWKFCKFAKRINPVHRSAFRFPEVQNWLQHPELFRSWTPLRGRLVVVWVLATFTLDSRSKMSFFLKRKIIGVCCGVHVWLVVFHSHQNG